LAQFDEHVLSDITRLIDLPHNAKRIADDGTLVSFERGEEKGMVRVTMAHEVVSRHHEFVSRFFENRAKKFCPPRLGARGPR
jgi:hypothetical protein